MLVITIITIAFYTAINIIALFMQDDMKEELFTEKSLVIKICQVICYLPAYVIMASIDLIEVL